jgi:hypothetical protein
MTLIPENDIVNKYLLNVNMPRDASVPLEVYIAFPATITDVEIREQVKKQWLNGNDKQYAAMQLLLNKEISAIFRPTGVLIDWQHISILIYTPSGLTVYLSPSQLRLLGVTIEEQLSNLNDYLFITINTQEDALVATELVPLRGKVEVDVAKEILEKTEMTYIDLIVTGLGYNATPEIKRLFLPRIVSWFKGFDGKPMHIAQFTLPETAKTHWAIRNETLFNWRYIPEPPTLARLVLDARQGILGEVFLRNGIVFDEFDKWTLETGDRRMTFDAILTGMEQGKWTRGVSALGVRAPDIARLIPIVFFGNLGDFAKLYGVMQYCTRAWFTEIFSRRLTHDISALADRIAVIDCCFTKISVMDALNNKVLPDSILRGIVSAIQSNVKEEHGSHLKGRLRRHSDNLYAILKNFMKMTPEDADAIVAGVFEFDRQLPHKAKENGVPPQRDFTQLKGTLQQLPQLTIPQVQLHIQEIVNEQEKTVGMAERAYILKVLNTQYGVKLDQYHEALNAMLKDGTLFEPKEGYIKFSEIKKL